MSNLRRLYPMMYQFLMDDFHRHLANAIAARKLGDQAKHSVEVKEVRRALRDFNVLLNEFNPDEKQI